MRQTTFTHVAILNPADRKRLRRLRRLRLLLVLVLVHKQIIPTQVSYSAAVAPAAVSAAVDDGGAGGRDGGQ